MSSLSNKNTSILVEIGDPKCGNQVLSLTSEDCTLESLAGGKGASLAQMLTISNNLEATIPLGLVVTTKAFNKHVETCQDLSEIITDLQDTSNQLCAALKNDEKTKLKSKLEEKCKRYVS